MVVLENVEISWLRSITDEQADYIDEPVSTTHLFKYDGAYEGSEIDFLIEGYDGDPVTDSQDEFTWQRRSDDLGQVEGGIISDVVITASLYIDGSLAMEVDSEENGLSDVQDMMLILDKCPGITAPVLVHLIENFSGDVNDIESLVMDDMYTIYIGSAYDVVSEILGERWDIPTVDHIINYVDCEDYLDDHEVEEVEGDVWIEVRA